MSLLQISDLSLSIGHTQVLHNISMDINAGEILGVIGESGSGKSMTAFASMQLLPERATCSGKIMLSGKDVLSLSERDLCRMRGNDVGMVFQEPMTALNPVKNIGDQVAETIRIHEPNVSKKDALQRAREALNRCELSEDRFPLTRYPHEMSGGQRQRVVIAMAIARHPKLLIADEPTTALDVTTQAEILELLIKLVREDGMGLMMITHDLAVVADMADRIVIMKEGHIVEQGETKALFASMSHPYTKALFQASSHQPERNAEIKETPLLEVKNVSRDYSLPRKKLFAPAGHFRAVNGVSFEIKRGESLGLVGESGCGKSTLTRAILGLEAVQEGEVLLDGAPVLNNRSVRRKLQVVFQDPYGSFNPRWKVRRLISEPFYLLDHPPKGIELEKALDEALISVGLSPSDKDKYIHEFSGGQRQRIAIARAIIIRPDLILLDEAVSALDVSVRAQVLDLLAELSKSYGLTYLFISHDLSVVRNITDRVLVMKGGEIVEQGETHQVFDQPSHPYTKKLINAAPKLPEDLKDIA